ncbi:hypothetical protein [Leptospira kanakyensis]|uniref:hypothetical protein n=1 Tax=Leptospira kanakyensis TaxID=2484968 RepID=UPI00223D2B60|nr:hypothetical protein [Leptospira kanakyensis]MCW7471813.1 hypothetical protein [Leptospira kanakyensis]
MIDKIINNINDFLKERFSSPIWLSLIASWCVINWEIIFVIFANDLNSNIYERLTYINNKLINSYSNLYLPITCTILYVLLFPFISLGITAIWSWTDNKKNQLINKIYKNRQLTIDESLTLRENHEKLKEEFSNLSRLKDIEMRNMKDELNRLSNKIIESSKEIDKNSLHEKKINQLIDKINSKFANDKPLLNQILNYVSGAYTMTGLDEEAEDIRKFLVANQIIEILDHKQLVYKFTELGKEIIAKLID